MVEEVRKRERVITPVIERESDKLLAQISKVHGPNIMRRATVAGQWKHIPLDVFTLDMAMFGGVYRSSITMFFGWESGGKTTMGMRALARAQKMFPDQRVALIDAEGTYDPLWGATHGINNEEMLLVQPETGEQALDIANGLLRSADISMVMVDSIPALVPAKEQEKSLEDDIVAMQARLIGRFIRVANCAILDERKRGHLPALLLINQWRSKIAMMGDTRNLPGGNALKFFVFNRVELMNKEILGKDQYDMEIVSHNEHSFKVTKLKDAGGIRNGQFTMIRDPGNPLGSGFIDEADTVLAFAKRFGVWSGAGTNQRFDDLDRKFATMRDGALHLYENPEFFSRLKHRLISMHREHMGLNPNDWI